MLEKLKTLFSARDMTVGKPWKRIAEFAFPMLVGNFVQQLYNTVDAVVVGRSSWGYTALAAVGNAMPILNLLLALFMGISTGAGILVSQYFGAKEREKLNKTVGACIFFSAAASVVIMVVGPLITGPLLRLVNTLPEVFENCRDYLNIYFIGIAGFFFYNIFSGILRGLGDSFSSLLYLFICAMLNIVGDLLLVNRMGVAGVSLATVLAQTLSAVLCLIKLRRMRNVFDLKWHYLKAEKFYLKEIVRLGIPSGLTQAIFSCATMVVQGLINSFNDAMFVACNVMVMRVDGFAMMPNFSFGMALSTYAGQNVGAKKLDRLYSGTRQGTFMALATSVVTTPLVLLAGPSLMRLFTPDEPELIRMSMQGMYILAAGYVAFSVNQTLSGVMRGAGDTVTPMWIGIITTVVLRMPLAWGFAKLAERLGAPVWTQEKMIFVSLLVSWIIGLLLTIFLYVRGGWKKKQVNAIEAELKAARSAAAE